MIHLDSLYLKIKSIVKFWKMFPMFLGLGNLKNLWKHHLLVVLSTLSQCRLSFLVFHLLWLKRAFSVHTTNIFPMVNRWPCGVTNTSRCWGSALIGHITSNHWKKPGFVPEANTWDGTVDDSWASFSHYLWTHHVWYARWFWSKVGFGDIQVCFKISTFKFSVGFGAPLKWLTFKQ